MAQRLRVFISSPSDVPDERLRAGLIVDKLSHEYGRFFTIESYRWEHEAMLASAHFQDAIEPPSSFDIVLLILWSRLGTQLPERTAEREYRGIDGRSPVTGTEWEYEEALKAARERKAPDLLAFRNISPAPIDPRNIAAQAAGMAQLSALNDFWGRHFADRGVFLTAYDEYRTLEEFAQRLEQSLRKLIERRIKHASAAMMRLEPVWLSDPFRGLESYEFEHARIFFGREASIMKAAEQLAANARAGHAFLLVSGASGSGKSSLAKAGIVPRLLRPQRIEGIGFLRRLVFRPGGEENDLFLALAKALTGADCGGGGLPELMAPGQDAAALAAHLRSAAADPSYLFANALGRVTEAARKSGQLLAFEQAKLLLVLDQLEELYTVGGISLDERRLFVRLIGGLARSGAVWVIATMRADFWHRAAETPELVALAEGQGRLDLLAPSPSELAEMIRRPAQAAGLSFELHAKTGLALDAVLAEHAVAAPGALPLLSFTLDELYKASKARGDTILTHASYETLGSLEGAIARRADETLAGVPATAQATLPRVLRALTTVAGAGNETPVARTAQLSHFPDGSPARTLIDAFVAARLLVASSDRTAAATVHLAHEALISRWQRARDQLAEDRRDLETRTLIERQFGRWSAARGTSRYLLLLRNPDLANAVDLAKRWGEELDATTRDFINRSLRRARLTQWVTAAAAVLFAVVAGVAVYTRSEAINQRTLAENAAREANDQRNRALLSASRRLEELAEKAIANQQPTRAALLALEGLPGPGAGEERPYLAALESILYRAGTAFRELPSLGKSIENADHSRFAAIDAKGNAAVYDSETGNIVFPLGGQVNDIAYSRDFVATGSADKSAWLWDATTGRQLLTLQVDAPVSAISLIGKVLMTACSDGTASLWSIPDGKRQVLIKAPSGTIRSLSVLEKAQRAISDDDDRTVRLWDTARGEQLAVVALAAVDDSDRNFTPRIYGSLSPTGRFALIHRSSTSQLSDVVILDAADGRQVAQVDSVDGFIGERDDVYAVKYGDTPHFKVWDPGTNTVLIDRDAQVLWAGSKAFALWSKGGSTVEIFDRATLKTVATISAPAAITRAVDLPKVNQLFTASSDSTFAFWSLDDGHLVQQSAGKVDSVYGPYLDDRRLILSTQYDTASVWHDTISIWDTAKDVPLQTLKMDQRWDTQWRAKAIAGSTDGAFKVWDLETGAPYPAPDLKSDNGSNFRVQSPDYSDDGSRGAAAVSTQTVRVWDVKTGEKVEDIGMPTDGTSLTLSPDGGKLLVKSKDGAMRVWDVRSGSLLGAVDDIDEKPRFSPHGNLLFFRKMSKDYSTVLRTRVWRLDGTSPMTSLPLGQGPVGQGPVAQMRFMPAGAGLLVRRGPNALTPFPYRVQIYDVQSGSRLAEITGLERNINSAGLSNDGRHLAALSGGLGQIWDVATGKSLAAAPAEYGGAIDADWLQTKARDSHLEIWNIATAKLQAKLQGITESVNESTFSADGRYLATASHEGGARLWEAATGRQIAYFPEAVSVNFNHEGDRAFVSFMKDDAALDLVETDSGAVIKQFPAWESYAFSPDGSAAELTDSAGAHVIEVAKGGKRTDLAGADSQASFRLCASAKLVLGYSKKEDAFHLWDGQTGKKLTMPQWHGEPADYAVLTPDCRAMVLEYDNATFLYEFATQAIVPLQEQKTAIVYTRISDSGRLLLTIAKNGDAGLSDLANATPLTLLNGAGEAVKFVTFSSDERQLVTRSNKDVIRIWDVGHGKLIQTLNFDETEDPSFGVRTPDGKLPVLINQKFAAGTNVLQELDDTGAAKAGFRMGHTITNFAPNSDGSRILAQTADNGVELWDTAHATRLAQMPGGSGDALFSFSADGRRIAELNHSYSGWSFQLWDADGQKQITAQKFKGSEDFQSGFTPDSRHFWILVWSYSSPAKILVFDAGTGASERTIDLNVNFAVDSNGERLVDYPKSGDGRIWDIASGKQIGTIPSLNEDSKTRFSPDGTLIATVKDHEIDLWDAANGSMRAALPGQIGVTAMALSRNGEYLASGSYDGVLNVWSVADKKLRYVRTVKPFGATTSQGETINRVFFSDDARRLIVRSDHAIGVWTMAAGEETAQMAPIEGALTLSPDARLLLRGGGSEAVRVDRIFAQPSDTVAAGRTAAPRCLTRAERDADFLDAEPPAWCIEMNKWPYQGPDWQAWLAARRNHAAAPMPQTAE